jgi:flagellar basal body rod protein FlgG
VDLALDGKGFLSVRGPNGPIYTRNGSLQVSPKGDLLAADGWAVLDTKGKPVRIDPAFSFEIDRQGNVSQKGQPVAQLAIVEFATPSDLAKVGKNYFQAGPKNPPIASTETEVRQGHLESSNVDSSEVAVRLVTVLRQFEMLQKAVAQAAEMNRKTIDEVAKAHS